MRSSVRGGFQQLYQRVRFYTAAPLAMVVGLILLLMGCASPSTSGVPTGTHAAHVAGQQVTVRGSGGWVETQVSVAPGERLTVSCDGKSNLAGAQQAIVGPAGTGHLAQGSGYPLPGVYTGGVLGRVGGGPPFYVGAYFDHTLVPATGSGKLALRVNAPSGSGSGNFTCRVATRRFSAQPVSSTLYGNAVVRIDDPQHQGFGGPYNQGLKLTSVTDGSKTLIELTSFPGLKVGAVSTQAGTDTITITAVNVFGAFGPYGPTSALAGGNIKGLPLTLRFHNSIGFAGDCTAPFTFTTGISVSPSGHFRATGVPMDKGGTATLVGTSKFSCNALYNPTDGKDVQMTIYGTFAPSPLD